ncbi:MAG: cupin domain-containing protein [Methanolinea sp.]
MLKFINRYFIHSDSRGSIQGLINSGTWKEINLISSDKEILRGNHYHKNTLELFIILEGEIEVRTQKVGENILEGEPSVFHVKSGDVFLIEPMINHIFIPHTYSRWLNVLSECVDVENPDFHRAGF